MKKRIVGLFTIQAMLLTFLYFRVADLSRSDRLTDAGAGQTTYTLTAYKMRANIYDRNFKRLVNTEEAFSAAVLPGDTDGAFFEYFSPDRASELSAFVASGKPFITSCEEKAKGASGVTVFPYFERYAEDMLATHIIGYTNDVGDGVAGIEKTYNEYLKEVGERAQISYAVNGGGYFLEGTQPEINISGEKDGGVVLTLDKEIQKIAEEAGEKIKKGAVVVMDPYNGEILASASFPRLDIHNLSDAASSADSPFINRAFASYSIGSVFKIVMCAAALENGVDESFECEGKVLMEDTVFRCHKIEGHGTLNMRGAMEESCNPFFIKLGARLGFSAIRNTAEKLGFGKGVLGEAGNLPLVSDIKNNGDLANFSFGQGSLSATPVQMAAVVSAVVNSGNCPEPILVKGYADISGSNLKETAAKASFTRAFSAETAAKVKSFMISTVTDGTGSPARPSTDEAGGKTGSAETGRFKENGKEIINAWFCGFYPAASPKYSIVVLCEDGVSGSVTCGPVFKEICEKIEENGCIDKE